MNVLSRILSFAFLFSFASLSALSANGAGFLPAVGDYAKVEVTQITRTSSNENIRRTVIEKEVIAVDLAKGSYKVQYTETFEDGQQRIYVTNYRGAKESALSSANRFRQCSYLKLTSKPVTVRAGTFSGCYWVSGSEKHYSVRADAEVPFYTVKNLSVTNSAPDTSITNSEELIEYRKF